MSTADRLKLEGKFNMMIEMIRNARKNGLSESIIAKIVNLDIESVNKILNNEPVDIPMHLMATDVQV